MPMTSGNWYTVTFYALGTWATPIGSTLPDFVTTAIRDNTTVYVFCKDSTLSGGTKAQIFFLDGAGNSGSAIVQHAGVNVVSTPTQDVTTWDDGDVWTSVRVGVALLTHSETAGGIRRLADSTAFGTFAS